METARPCFLVIDREYAGTISTRKLVIETAKFNVITAYSAFEAIATLRKFPAITGVVLDGGMRDIRACELIRSLKKVVPSVRAVLVGRPNAETCPEADHNVETFDPKRILELLQRLEPEQTKAILTHEEKLQYEES
jgi:response regulator RpfG family c-di-GMP phosphodiesterase